MVPNHRAIDQPRRHAEPRGDPTAVAFAKWVVAAEPSLPWKPGAFLAAYATNREAAHESALEASPIADVLRRWFDRRDGVSYRGMAKELLAELGSFAFPKPDPGTPERKQPKGWPKSSVGLSKALRRVAPNLRAVGIDVQFDTEGRGNDKRRIIVVRRFGGNIDPTDPTDPDPACDSQNTDSRGRSENAGDETAPSEPSPENQLCDPENTDGNGGDDGDGHLHHCSNIDDDDSDRRERGAIMEVEAEAGAVATRANGGAFTA
ncbi:MAG: hypothetical protein V1790_05240 [Planctomycetota bacterium]